MLTPNRKGIPLPMQIILCTGDSHTWGQGATGVETSFPTPLVCGDLRPVGFSYPCYVNRFRRWIRDSYGGEFAEYTPQSFSDTEYPLDLNCLKLQVGDTLCFPSQDAYRFVFRQTDESGTVSFSDNSLVSLTHTITPSTESNAYDIWFVEKSSETSVQLAVTSGIVFLYRLETYSGPFAVINAGIGSCPSGTYAEQWFSRYVEPYHPWLTIAEAHSINDWLQYSPETAQQGLSYLIKKLSDIHTHVIMLTVSPVDENQYNSIGHPYSDYIAISKTVADSFHIPLADAHSVMQQHLTAGNPLFADKWHVNDKGHAIYTNIILDTVLKLDLLPKYNIIKE